MHRILLLVEQKENRRLLVELLKNRYSICIPESELGLAEPFDLCIADGLAFTQHQLQLQERKKAEEPIILPIILLTTRPDIGVFAGNLAQSIDDWLVIPIEKNQLLAKLEVLLRSRRLSLQLKAANTELNELNALKSRFLAMASHDIKNPLSGISSGIDLLQKYGDRLSEEQKERKFQQVRIAIKRMDNLLDEILLFSRSERGKLVLEPVPVNLEQFCCELVSDFQHSASNSHAIHFISQCILNGKSNSTVPAYLDEKLLRHLFGNLLANAIKYSPQGGTVWFELIYQLDKAIFKVRDCGIGIPVEERSQLFEAFWRSSNVGKIPGTGLGLSIVKQCVDLHGGAIAVESALGVGTTFTVELPLSRTVANERLV